MDKLLGNKWVESCANYPFKDSNSLSSLHAEQVTLHPRTEPVSERPLRASRSGLLQPLRPIPALVLRLSVEAPTWTELSLCLQDTMKWVNYTECCRFFFRARTTTFNLFLYIEDWTAAAAAGKFSILGEHHSVPLLKEALKQCSDWDSELKFLEQWRWSVLESASSVFKMFFFFLLFSSLPRLWPNTEHLNQSDYQVLNQIIKKTPSSTYFIKKLLRNSNLLQQMGVKTSYAWVQWSSVSLF